MRTINSLLVALALCLSTWHVTADVSGTTPPRYMRWPSATITLTTNTYLVTDRDVVMQMPNSAASVAGRTNTLPAASSSIGRILVIEDSGRTAFGTNVWIVASGSDTIEGGPTRTNIIADGGRVMMIGNSAGTGWNLLGSWPPIALSTGALTPNVIIEETTNAFGRNLYIRPMSYGGRNYQHMEISFTNSGTSNPDFLIRTAGTNFWMWDVDLFGDNAGILIAHISHPGAGDTKGWSYSDLYATAKSDLNPATANASNCAVRINALIKALSRLGVNEGHEGHGLLRP